MNAKRKKEWFDDDSFWHDLYSFMFSEERFIEAAEQVDNILKLTRPKGKSVLDLCCGPGRYAIVLARRGFRVTGVDRTNYLLDKAKERISAENIEIEWVLKDMRDFIRPDSFDLILSMFTSFGYFDEKHEDVEVLKNMLTNLRPGGSCLIDIFGKEILAATRQPTKSEILPDNSKLVQCHEIYDNWTRIRNEWILIKDGHAKSYKFHHTIYSGQELKDRLAQVGFEDITLYGNLDGDDYGPQAQRLIAVGRKPET